MGTAHGDVDQDLVPDTVSKQHKCSNSWQQHASHGTKHAQAGKNTTAHCHLPKFCILPSQLQVENSLNLFRGSNVMQTTNPHSLLQARHVVCGQVLALTRFVTHHCSLLRPGMLCSLGQPMTAWIFSSWSISSLPGKMGLPTSSSAKMQPTLHMSISVLYSSAPRSSSGGLHCSRSNSLCYDSVCGKHYLLVRQTGCLSQQ